MSENLKRRHMDESQRGMVAHRLESMKIGRPENNVNLHRLSRSDAAEKLNVSQSTVAHAAKVDKKGTPALVEAVEQGNVAVSAAKLDEGRLHLGARAARHTGGKKSGKPTHQKCFVPK